MTKTNNTDNDDVDLIELCMDLWNGRRLIAAFITVAILLASIFLLVRDPLYTSKIICYADKIPPFVSETTMMSDFRTRFLSQSAFERWKNDHENAALVYQDISGTKVINGFKLTKSEEEKFLRIRNNEGISTLLISSNELPLLNEVYSYANYVSQLLTEEYIIQAKADLDIVDRRFNKLAGLDGQPVYAVLSAERYIASARKGELSIAIRHPTDPEKISPKPGFAFAISIIIGASMSVVFILVANAVSRRKTRFVASS